MGKNLKGKELGVGISQRKDGLYTGRYTDRNGNRHQKYFKKLQECRNWIADMQFQVKHGTIEAFSNMTVNAWFEYWITEIKGNNVRINTINNYKNYFKKVEKYMGTMILSEVRPLHCQNVLNKMVDNYRNSTIKQIRITMHALFDSAIENNLIASNPVVKSVNCKNGKKSKPERVLTIKEQQSFLIAAQESVYFNQFAFILQTGLRGGELIGLKWDDIDFESCEIHIQRSMGYSYYAKEWIIGPPKSESGCRTIPLTKEAINILKSQQEKISKSKVVSMEFKDFVFLCKKGTPIRISDYNCALSRICNRTMIKKISMHILRHTFATRCIEAGMRPKSLQKILGHSKISTTMNLYVHVTEDAKIDEIRNIEGMLKIV